MEEDQNKKGGADDGAKNSEQKEKVKDGPQRQRWTGRGDQRRERGYNNQRGQNKRNYYRHDDIRGSGDNSQSERTSGDTDGRQERQDQEWTGGKQAYRRNRPTRSNEDRNWRAAAPSSNQEEPQQSDSSSNRNDKGRKRHPDRQLYSPRSRFQEEINSDTNKTGSSSYDNSRPRRTDNRPGYRSGRSNYQGESKNKRVIVRERPDSKSEESAKDNEPQERRGSKDNLVTETNEKKMVGAEGGKSNPKDFKKYKETRRQRPDDTKAAANVSEQQSEEEEKGSKYLEKKMASYIASGESADSYDPSPVPGLRTSPTMGLEANPHKASYPSGAGYGGSEEMYGDGAAYAPVGVNAFGLYQDPYGIPAPAAAMQYASEVSIGRGARWNEWYHNLWNGPPVDQRVINDAGRGFVPPTRGRSGRGQGYQNRGRHTGAKQERKRSQEDISDTKENKLKELAKSGKNVYAEEFHPRSFNSQPQPGFIKKGQQKSDSRPSKSSTKPKAGKAFSGSSETQTGTLIEQLTEGTYECLVCCDVVKCEARVWSCGSCYTVFHLKCIKDWAKSPAAAAEG